VLRLFLRAVILAAAIILLLFVPADARAKSGRIHFTFLRTKNTEDNRGVLFYDAQRYRLAIKGFESATGETKRIDLVGHALNLRKVEDITGAYHAADASTTVVSGSNRVRLQNDEGTVLELRAAKPLSSQIDLKGLILEGRGWQSKTSGSSGVK
jgi:hypothetical protein